MKIITSPKCLEYDHPGYPENSDRVRLTLEYLKAKKDSYGVDFEFIEPKPCAPEDILLVHTSAMVDKVRTGSFTDPDIYNMPGIYDISLLSAGAAVLAAETALQEGAQSTRSASFSLMRPPGHHATKSHSGGFCYFNNIAIASKKILLSGKGPVAILDFDCHHGNGTQNIMMGKDGVLFISLHQIPLYPGTGLRSEKNCINFPLPPGTSEKQYLSALEQALKEIEKFNPAVIAVSAGFDAYKEDTITQMSLEVESYKKIGNMIKSLNKPRFALLEGGYSPQLPECVYSFISGF